MLDISLNDTPAAALTAFSMCRVGYVVERGQLERVEPAPATCARLP